MNEPSKPPPDLHRNNNAGSRPSLLLVDDQTVNIQVLNEIFSRDHEVFFATSGAQALEMCRNCPPDLILLDILMPAMDGFEVCRTLKNDEHLRHIPIIFITALDEIDDESKGLALGAADYITKPFNPELVRLRVNNHLELKRQRDTLEQRTEELEKALAEIKQLQGIIPICATCKKIRDDQGSWQQMEAYIMKHSEAAFSHGICPGCAKEKYPDLFAEMFPDK